MTCCICEGKETVRFLYFFFFTHSVTFDVPGASCFIFAFLFLLIIVLLLYPYFSESVIATEIANL